MHEGHRKRMLERLEKDADGLQEHELLEILLYNAIPRKNTNEIAHALLDTFGGIDGVFRAGLDELSKVKGVGASTAAYLKCIAVFYQRVRFGASPVPAIFSVESLREFLAARFGGLLYEAVELYGLDANKRLKASKRFTSGDRDFVRVAPEDVSKFLVTYRPFALVVAHNHVGTANEPSREDDSFTAQVQMICSINNVRFYDHLIFGNNGIYSYFRSGKLQQIKDSFNVRTMLGGGRG